MKKTAQFKPTRGLETQSQKFDGRAPIKAMYDYTWEGYRLKFLAVNPRCYACGSESTVVDHLIPHQGDPALFKKLDNHIPLCAKCHNYITSKFDRYFRKGSAIIPKLTWIANNRTLNGYTGRVKVLGHYGK